jgi:hypothetical protein
MAKTAGSTRTGAFYTIIDMLTSKRSQADSMYSVSPFPQDKRDSKIAQTIS